MCSATTAGSLVPWTGNQTLVTADIVTCSATCRNPPNFFTPIHFLH